MGGGGGPGYAPNVLIFLAACHPEPSTSTPTTPVPTPVPVPTPTPSLPEPPVLVSGPTIVLPEADTVRLAQRLLASTDRPTRATVVVNDGSRSREIGFPDLTIDHDLDLLALRAETTYTVDATFTDADDLSITATVGFATGPLAGSFPNLELVYADPARAEPGYALFPAEIGDASHVLAVDPEGRIVGSWDGGATTRALMFGEGVFTAMQGNAIARWTPRGDVLDLWVPAGVLIPYAIVLPIEGVHHEVAFQSDGSFWTFHKAPVVVPDYPTSELDPFTTAPGEVDGDVVVHLAADGTLLNEWPLIDRLDPNRIGFGSLDASGGNGFDWAHANAIVPLPDEGMVLVSLRHQDAIVKLALPDGEIQWILGNPDGWSPEFVPYLLTPTAGTRWPYHQHGPMVGADGRITMFDNGNDRRTTPYSQDPVVGGLYTRIVQFEVDENNRTVTQTFESYGTQSPGGGYRLYSQALGNADVLPVTGNVFASFAYLHEENEVANVDISRGDKSLRVIEVDPLNGDTVWDLRAYTDFDTAPLGLLTDRAIHIPSLYPSTVTERWLP